MIWLKSLGLAPPPRPAAAASTAVPGTSNGKVGVATVPHASAAPSGRQRKPPRDPSAPAPPKRAAAKKAPPAPARLPAASLQPSPETASSMGPLHASTTWMEPGASSPATVATGALVVLDGMPTRADEDRQISLSSSDDCGSHGKAKHSDVAFSGHLGQEPKNKSSDDALKAPKGKKKTPKGRLQQRKFESDNSDGSQQSAGVSRQKSMEVLVPDLQLKISTTKSNGGVDMGFQIAVSRSVLIHLPELALSDRTPWQQPCCVVRGKPSAGKRAHINHTPWPAEIGFIPM